MNNLKRLISALITVLFCAYIYISKDEIVSTLKLVSLTYLLVIAFFHVLILFANSKILKLQVHVLKKKISVVESYKLTVVSSFVNFFTPLVGGLGVKGVYLRKNFGVAFTEFGGVVFASYVLIFLVSFVIGGLSLTIVNSQQSAARLLLAYLFMAGVLVMLALFVFTFRVFSTVVDMFKNRKFYANIKEKIALASSSLDVLKKDKATVTHLILWIIVAQTLIAFMYYTILRAINLELTVGAALLYSSLSTISLLLNITPGSIGLREALYGSVGIITGVGISEIIAFSLIDRTIQTLVLGAGWLYYGRKI